ncbi:MAG: ABC transporter substrate-binding protein, partial [candidate division NC10 bacterium]
LAGSQAEQIPLGPWLDEVVWAEEDDPSKAMRELRQGRAAVLTFPLSSLDDIAQAHSSVEVQSVSTYRFTDAFLMNPSKQTAQHPENPFAIDEVRAAMQLLIDREFIVREVWRSFALPQETMWHPHSPNYGRGIADFLLLEERWTFDPHRGRTMMFEALEAHGWAKGADGFWHDSTGRLVTIRGIIRRIDERVQMGRYYADLFRGLNFDVEPMSDIDMRTPYGDPPDEGLWHFYTEGWVGATHGWNDDHIWFWSCGVGFEPYCEHRPEDSANDNVYTVNQELANISDAILAAAYSTFDERQSLIARATELAMDAPIRVFIDVREAPFVYARDFQAGVFDLLGGPANPWFLKAATVPEDATTGFRTARVLSPVMFVDAWNPWIEREWFYDAVQRSAMSDPGQARHPHNGRWTGFRAAASVETAGPDGALTVPSDALSFDLTEYRWIEVGTGVQALSRVTLDLTRGSWHHGPPLTMDDVLYTISNAYRRLFGDIYEARGIVRAAVPFPEETFYRQALKGFRVLDEDTLEIYVDYWHLDPAEISGYVASFPNPVLAGSLDLFPNAPWEVQELAAQTVLDGEADYTEWVAGAQDKTWLDLTKGDSLPLLEVDLAALRAANHIPPGMESFITDEEAAQRWDAIATWYTDKGHFWPSQGPFLLESVDLLSRTTRMKAFRDYPWPADHWEELPLVRNAQLSVFSSPPAVTFSGFEARFGLRVVVGERPSDAFEGHWFLLDRTTRESVAEGIPVRVGTGLYEIVITAGRTKNLVQGDFELIAVALGEEVPLPSIVRESLLILPWPSYFVELVDRFVEREDRAYQAFSRELSLTQAEIRRLTETISAVASVATSFLFLTAAAVALSTGSLIVVLRRRQ